MIYRNLTPFIKNSKKSVLLLGPRQVGKSTLVSSLKPDLSFNLSDDQEFFAFTSNPSELSTRIDTLQPKTVFIDEIQRYPSLLNTIQAIIDKNKNIKFFLTGSSARKLKRGKANLLPGRVFNYLLGSLVSSELRYDMHSENVLKFGALPEIYLEKNDSIKTKMLKTYLTNYIQEEIRAESIVRNIDAFSRAIPFAIQTSGQFIDYSKLAKKAKISRHSLSRFYEIFEDTLVGTRAWPDNKLLEKADLVKHPKFYIFDIGIYNALAQCYELSNERIGILFEHLLFNQFLHSCWSKDKDIEVSTFRTRGGLEVDFILTIDGKRIAVEAKATREVFSEDVSSLLELKKSYETNIEIFVAYLGKESKKINGVWCHPWQLLLKHLGI